MSGWEGCWHVGKKHLQEVVGTSQLDSSKIGWKRNSEMGRKCVVGRKNLERSRHAARNRYIVERRHTGGRKYAAGVGRQKEKKERKKERAGNRHLRTAST